MPTEATAEVAAPRTNSEPPPVSTTNGNSPTAQFFPSDNVRPPAFLLNDENAERLSELRRLNKEFLGPRFTSITVAEGLARELRERQPFQGSRSATISEATMLAKEADRELESAKLQVKACNNDIAVQHAKNVEAAAECKALRLGSLPGQNEVTRKRKLVEEGVEKLLSGATESQKFVGEDLRITLATSEGCKQMLDRQMAAMQDVKKEKETAIENSSKLKAEIAPLRKAVKKLRTTFAFNASITPESDSTSSAEKRDSEAIDHEIRDMCMWYTEANALISGVSGVTMDTAQSFGATTARINIHGCDHVSEGDSADVNTLIVHFEPDSTRVCGAELEPPLAPMSDIVAVASSEHNSSLNSNFNSTLMCLIREARVRISGAAQRKAEFEALKKKYVVQWNFGGNTRNSEPAASAWLYVRATIPGGIVVEMRTAPDYPKPYTRIDVVQVCGIMGWSHDDEKRLLEHAKSLNLNSVTEMVDSIAMQVGKD